MFNQGKERPTGGEMKRWLTAIGVRKGNNALFSRNTDPSNLQYVGKFKGVTWDRVIVFKTGNQWGGDRLPLYIRMKPDEVRTLSDHGKAGYEGQRVIKK